MQSSKKFWQQQLIALFFSFSLSVLVDPEQSLVRIVGLMGREICVGQRNNWSTCLTYCIKSIGVIIRVYEGKLDKRFMNFIALQPRVFDEAFMPHMKAIDVSFHFLYGCLTCYQRL